MTYVILILLSDPSTLTQLDVRAGFAAPVRVQDQKANFEEETVWRHIESTHLVKAVTAHHQRNESDAFTQHIDVVNYPIDSCLRDMLKRVKKVFEMLHSFKRKYFDTWVNTCICSLALK